MVEASANSEPALRDMEKDPEKSHQVIYYQFDDEIKEKCQKVIENDGTELSDFVKEKLEKEAMKNWDVFYSHHKDNFWKDRHYLKREFFEFVDALKEHKEKGTEEKYPVRLLDTGCGVGNSFYPMFEYFDNFSVDCFDFSPKAVEALKTHKWYNPERIDAKVCDIVKDERIPFEENSADFGMVIFLLSAISPENFPVALSKLNQCMKMGSVVYFRDYGLYDQAQLRFAEKKKQRIGENFYVRQDKTRAYYFSLEEVEKLFREAGFEEVIENVNHYRLIENRKKGLKMYRVWVQGKFRKTKNVDLLMAKADKEYQYEKYLKEHKQTAEELIAEAKVKKQE